MRAKLVLAAAVVAALGFTVAQKAEACGSCGVVTQPAIMDTTMVQPALIDTSVTSPVVLTQPAVLDTSISQPMVITQPAVMDAPIYSDPHLLNLDTPFFGIHLF
jgi:hypothetical protein